MQFYLVIKCQKPEEAKPLFDVWLAKTIETAMKAEGELMEVFGTHSGIEFSFEAGDHEVFK